MFWGLMKRYSVTDDQSDIFGIECWQYISDLHQRSKASLFKLLPFILKFIVSRILRTNVLFNRKYLDNAPLSIDYEQGRLLYSLVLAKMPSVVFEFGSSVGISALYIAQALKEINNGHLFGTEINIGKYKIAKKNLKTCHLNDKVTIYQADIFETLKKFNHPIDFLFMDGFPNINLQVFKAIEPLLTKGCVILTDDAILFQREMNEYLTYLMDSPNYSTQIIKISTGMCLSIKK